MNVDDYEGDFYEEEEKQQPPPRRHRPARHSVPLRAHVGTRQASPTRTTADVLPGIMRPPFGQTRPAQEQQQAQWLARQAKQRPVPAAPTKSYIPHTALPVLPDDDDRRIGKSQLRYVDAQGRYVWRQDHRQLVFEEVQPPPRHRRRSHWLLWLGLGMLVMISIAVGWNGAASAIAAHNLDSQYGYPRTWQIDAVVGHEDSAARPSHFVFENLHGHILITEYPGGDIAHAHIYSVSSVYSDQLPVTGSFQDINGDGRPDMLVQIGTDTPNTLTITFLNNGTQFVATS